jgi:hypothetical protein
MDKRDVARKALSRVNAARDLVVENRERWPELQGLLGINKRWLRAFASGQIAQPPAARFLAIESCLGNGQRRPKKKAGAVARPG